MSEPCSVPNNLQLKKYPLPDLTAMRPRVSFSMYRAVLWALADPAIMNTIPTVIEKTTMDLYFIRPLLLAIGLRPVEA